MLTYIEWRNISILDISRQHTHLHHLHCAALHCNLHIYKYMYNYTIYVYGIYVLFVIICDIYAVYLYYIYIYYDVITPIYVYSTHNYLYYNTTYIRICFATQASKHLSRRRVKPCTTSSWTSWTTTSKKSLISSGGNHMIQVGPCEECLHFKQGWQEYHKRGWSSPYL